MRNILNTTVLAATLLSNNAAAKDTTDLDPAAVIHYCEVDPSKSFGDVIAIAEQFSPRLNDAATVEPDEFIAARKAKAEATLKLALTELSPEKLSQLAVEIKKLTEIKPGTSTADDIKAEDVILAELKSKLTILSSLVTKDSSNVMQVVPVDVSEKTIKENDLALAYTELAERGIVCPDPVVSYTVEYNAFPELSRDGLNSTLYATHLANLVVSDVEPVAPAVAPKKPAPAVVAGQVIEADVNVTFMKKLQAMLSQFSRLQKDSSAAIQIYTGYIGSKNL